MKYLLTDDEREIVQDEMDLIVNRECWYCCIALNKAQFKDKNRMKTKRILSGVFSSVFKNGIECSWWSMKTPSDWRLGGPLSEETQRILNEKLNALTTMK